MRLPWSRREPEFVNHGPAEEPWGRPLYPNCYVWFVLMSTLDVVLTFVILWFDGREVNGLADWILQRYGIGGMAVFKFVIVVFVVLLCEFLGRQSASAGRRLAEWSIALTCVPVVVATALLVSHALKQ